MPLSPLPPVGIVSVQQLRAMGWSRSDIDRELRARSLWRIRKGYYCLPSAEPRLVRAVRLGGIATGPTALRQHGIWVPPSERRLHALVRENAARLSAPDHRFERLKPGDPGVHVHWTRSRPVRGALEAFAPVVAPLLALEHSFACLSGEMMVAAMDSALNRRLVTVADLQALKRRLPTHQQSLVDEVDGRAQAGCESLVRVRLRRLGLRVVPQRAVRAAGKIDLVVEDVLGIETDGAESHAVLEQFLEDRRRDLVLAGAALDRLRFTQPQVLDEWPACERAVLASVRRFRPAVAS